MDVVSELTIVFPYRMALSHSSSLIATEIIRQTVARSTLGQTHAVHTDVSALPSSRMSRPTECIIRIAYRS
jgi:hypothetical protein